MIPLNTVFWGLVFLFGMIGALRGWAKEILVTSSVFLAMFIQQVFGQYVLGPANPYLPMLLRVSDEIVPLPTYSPTQLYYKNHQKANNHHSRPDIGLHLSFSTFPSHRPS